MSLFWGEGVVFLEVEKKSVVDFFFFDWGGPSWKNAWSGS
jgi:hypothetical protein